MAGFIRTNEKNQPIIAFGKYKNKTIDDIYEINPGYFSWINQAEFPQYTKKILKELVAEVKLKRKFEN